MVLDVCAALGWSLARWHELTRDEQVRWIAWWRVKHVPVAEAKPTKVPRAVKSARG